MEWPSQSTLTSIVLLVLVLAAMALRRKRAENKAAPPLLAGPTW